MTMPKDLLTAEYRQAIEFACCLYAAGAKSVPRVYPEGPLKPDMQRGWQLASEYLEILPTKLNRDLEDDTLMRAQANSIVSRIGKEVLCQKA